MILSLRNQGHSVSHFFSEALFASELISAERLVGTRWRMLHVSYFYTSHRGCCPHGVSVHTSVFVFLDGAVSEQ